MYDFFPPHLYSANQTTVLGKISSHRCNKYKLYASVSFTLNSRAAIKTDLEIPRVQRWRIQIEFFSSIFSVVLDC